MYIDEVIRIGYATGGGFFVSYDKNISPSEAAKEEKAASNKDITPWEEKWVTRYVPTPEGVAAAIEGILEKAEKPKPPQDEFDDAFKLAVKEK